MTDDVDQQLQDAAERGDIVAVQALLASGADPNSRDVFHGGTPLHSAVASHNPELVRMLVNCGANVNIATQNTNSTPLGSAMLFGDEPMVRILLDHGARLSTTEIITELIAEVRDLGFRDIALAVETALGKQSARRCD